jgi:putative DNA primase/helicase
VGAPNAFETIAALIDGAQPFGPWIPPAPGDRVSGRHKKTSRRAKPASLRAVTQPLPPEDGRPAVKIVGGELPRQVGEAEAALIASRPDIYRYGGQLVRPVIEEVPAADMTWTQVHRLVPVTRSYLIDVLTSAARWERYDRRSKAWFDVDCPNQIAETYLAREGRWRMPP